MRVDWQQELEGYSLRQIRDALRGPRYADTPFPAELLCERLPGASKTTVQKIMAALMESGLVQPSEENPSWFVLTDTGISLRAANASKRFKRARADKAVAKMLERVAEINADPIFMHDVTALAVYGSYITDAPDLGDIDIAIELKGRWAMGCGDFSDREERKARFDATHLPPESFYDKWWWATWAETYTRRLLRTDPGVKAIELQELELMGCPYRIIFPEARDVPAKPDWSFKREQVVLKTAAAAEI